LLLFVLVVLATGAGLLLLAKRAQAPDPKTVILVNTASAEALSRALGMPARVGEQIVAERTRRAEQQRSRRPVFADVGALGRLSIVPDRAEAVRRLKASNLTPARHRETRSPRRSGRPMTRTPPPGS
jgi:hypothetical protein